MLVVPVLTAAFRTPTQQLQNRERLPPIRGLPW